MPLGGSLFCLVFFFSFVLFSFFLLSCFFFSESGVVLVRLRLQGHLLFFLFFVVFYAWVGMLGDGGGEMEEEAAGGEITIN
jgi:hypothetical protein